jgi:hypothetical protein
VGRRQVQVRAARRARVRRRRSGSGGHRGAWGFFRTPASWLRPAGRA